MSSMYELTADYLALLNYADSEDPEEQQAFIDTLEGLTGEIEMKADNCAHVITMLEGKINMIDLEIERLTKMRNAEKIAIDRIKAMIKGAMEIMETAKIQTGLHTFAIQKNGGKQRLKIEGEVPDNYKRVVYETDSDKIRADLEKGIDLPFAKLEERGTHLRIK